ncbi:hypothetical protein AAG570_002850, partial [Ranatra chinensis]
SRKWQTLDPRFECPICLTCLKEPVLTTCGHRFCRGCIHPWLQKEGSCCPIDGQTLSGEQDLFPDNYTRREIAQQVVECHYPGCSAKKVPLVDMEHHIALAHEKSRKLKGGGIVDDGKAEEAEMWSPPPKQQSPDSTAFGTMYERIVLLEQSSREQQIQCDNLKRRVDTLSEENCRLKVELPLRVCSGTHVWRLTQTTQKLSAMTKDNSVMYYSDGFYTSFAGYRFCARLNVSPSNSDFLSLLVHLMRGDNDDCLSWPFSGRIALTLIHPTVQELSVREVMCSRPELDAFKRPTRQISMRGFGYTEFVTIADVISRGFISANDVLNIKIQINCV